MLFYAPQKTVPGSFPVYRPSPSSVFPPAQSFLYKNPLRNLRRGFSERRYIVNAGLSGGWDALQPHGTQNVSVIALISKFQIALRIKFGVNGLQKFDVKNILAIIVFLYSVFTEVTVNADYQRKRFTNDGGTGGGGWTSVPVCFRGDGNRRSRARIQSGDRGRCREEAWRSFSFLFLLIK